MEALLLIKYIILTNFIGLFVYWFNDIRLLILNLLTILLNLILDLVLYLKIKK